jgi:hypothetical protein
MPLEVVDRVHALCKSKKENTEPIVHNIYVAYHDYSETELGNDDDEEEDFTLQNIHEDLNLIGDG